MRFFVHKAKKAKGFTLIELLVVISIIGMLSTIVLAALNDSRQSAQESQVVAEMYNVRVAMELLYHDTGLYPLGIDNYCPPSPPGAPQRVSLASPDAGIVTGNLALFPAWDGPYMANAIDPWGNPYFFDRSYQCNEDTYGCNGKSDDGPKSSVIVSCGPDGQTIGADRCQTGGPAGKDNIVFIFCRED